MSSVSATGLSLYAEQRVDFVQEIVDYQMILHKGVRFTQQISSLVLNLWCKDLVPQKRGKGNAVSVSSVSATGLSLYAEQRVDFVQEIVDYQMILHKGVRFTQQISSLVLNLWCKDLVPQKRGKGNAVSVSSVSATGLSLYAEQRVDFVQEIVDYQMILHKGVRFTQQISSLVLNLWCKDLVPQKRGKGNAVSVSSVSATGLSLYAKQRVDFVQEIERIWMTRGDQSFTGK